MTKFRKRPLVIEAEQFDGSLESATKICGPGGTRNLNYGNPGPGDLGLCIFVHTPEGTMTASPGDWIIRGVAGELYPCKDAIFRATYEPATEEIRPGHQGHEISAFGEQRPD